MAEHSAEFMKQILEKVKILTNQGKHVEASNLFNTYFPGFSDLKKK